VETAAISEEESRRFIQALPVKLMQAYRDIFVPDVNHRHHAHLVMDTESALTALKRAHQATHGRDYSWEQVMALSVSERKKYDKKLPATSKAFMKALPPGHVLHRGTK